MKYLNISLVLSSSMLLAGCFGDNSSSSTDGTDGTDGLISENGCLNFAQSIQVSQEREVSYNTVETVVRTYERSWSDEHQSLSIKTFPLAESNAEEQGIRYSSVNDFIKEESILGLITRLSYSYHKSTSQYTDYSYSDAGELTEYTLTHDHWGDGVDVYTTQRVVSGLDDKGRVLSETVNDYDVDYRSGGLLSSYIITYSYNDEEKIITKVFDYVDRSSVSKYYYDKLHQNFKTESWSDTRVAAGVPDSVETKTIQYSDIVELCGS